MFLLRLVTSMIILFILVLVMFMIYLFQNLIIQLPNCSTYAFVQSRSWVSAQQMLQFYSGLNAILAPSSTRVGLARPRLRLRCCCRRRRHRRLREACSSVENANSKENKVACCPHKTWCWFAWVIKLTKIKKQPCVLLVTLQETSYVQKRFKYCILMICSVCLPET